MAASQITNVFVVVMENRSFDHMLGFSGITGTDPSTGQSTSINGLSGTESNAYNSITYTVSQPAPATMAVDPGHEFLDVLIQLLGSDAYSGGNYPQPITNVGFVSDYAWSPSPGEGNAPTADLGQIMGCNSTSQLPVLNALATNFVVCDNWYSSMPGPTWPNRFFGMGASSGSLDHSPTTKQIIEWETGIPSGFSFPNGSIFDAINGQTGGSYRLYFDGDFSITQANLPIVSALKGITISDVNSFSNFASDLSSSSGYPYWYTYIEPSYGDAASGTYDGGNCEHPLETVDSGEAFLKTLYETLRASPIWDTSLLIITWDEHGGFYDHVAPPTAVAPGDTFQPQYNQYQFNFEQYGVRVPAIVVSPLIAENLVDHTLYDHTTFLATLESIFGIPSLTQRDGQANNLTSLITLSTPRSTPKTLPAPPTIAPATVAAAAKVRAAKAAAAKKDPVDTGNLPGFLHLAMRYDKQLSPPEAAPQIHARVASLKTRADAQQYLAEVDAKAKAKKRR